MQTPVGGSAESGSAGAATSAAGAVSAQPMASGASGAGSGGSPATAGSAGSPAAAGSGGSVAAAGSGQQPSAAGASGQSGAGASSSDATSNGPLVLEATGASALSDGYVAFPPSARPPTNESPGFSWSGAPEDTKSLALVFRDVTSSTPPVKWVLWNIPPTLTEIPANVSKDSANPGEVPGSSQLGSLGNLGYAGPCCDDNKYEWILYALDVDRLPGTDLLSTAQINMTVIPDHTIAKSKAVMMRIMP